jgi:DNA-binding protein HU-beta
VKFVFQDITEAVKKGEKVSIQGFGAFELRELRERKIKNSRTGELLEVPRRKKVVFIPRIKGVQVYAAGFSGNDGSFFVDKKGRAARSRHSSLRFVPITTAVLPKLLLKRIIKIGDKSKRF